jgi:3-phosphoshikimate 1-carboxyvinyltransferase
MLPCFGVDVKTGDLTVELNGPARLTACEINVPGDFSSAAFFIAAASVVENSELIIENIGMNPTRTGFIDIIKKMGGNIKLTNERTLNGEPRADLWVKTGQFTAVELSGGWIPRIIDEIPIFAVIATQAKGTTIVRDAKELRVKETDRISARAKNFEAMGIRIEVHEDGFILEGPQTLNAAAINSYDDHRIAMAFSIAGLIADGVTVIRNSDCVDISYPGFFKTLENVVHA